MYDPSSGMAELGRRDFIRRATMAALATGVGSVIYGFGVRRGTAEAGEAVAPLRIRGVVTGITAVDDGLVAVGTRPRGGISEPAVWRYRAADATWSSPSGAHSFPKGTSLAGIAAVENTLVAVGDVAGLARVQTILDDETGQPMLIPVYAVVPAIFASFDAITWREVIRGMPEATLGSFGAVATTQNGGQALAVGSRALEPGVSEPYGLVAAASANGSSWRQTHLAGVVEPRHGLVTLLARVGESLVLATSGIRESTLYRGSEAGWSRIVAPAADVSYTAAGGTDTDFVVAGLDSLGKPRMWRRLDTGWHELADPFARASHGPITALEAFNGSLVAAQVAEGGGTISTIGG
jgi:hypothetical protein